MKYIIKVRRLEEQEALTRDCYFAETDEESFATHLKALVEDIENNEMVSNASEVNNAITIESNLNVKDLQKNLKNIFTREYCFIRIESIEEIT